jgi:hypothetical protein
MSTEQAEEGRELFARSAAVDERLEKQESTELSAMTKQMDLAQQKFRRDQAKVQHVVDRIKRIRSEDKIPQIHFGARAGYRVDVQQGSATQV